MTDSVMPQWHALPWHWGWINLATQGEQLQRLDMATAPHPASLMDSQHPWAVAVEAWLAGDWQAFDGLPLAPSGTEFQRQVWQALQAIPPGEVRAYGELARLVDSGPRAVAGACRRNPIALVIPCHRVVAADGIGGYSGATGGDAVARKRWLLAREGLHFS